MPNLNAALLLAQLEGLEGFLEQKKKLHHTYQEMLSNSPEGVLQTAPVDSISNLLA